MRTASLCLALVISLLHSQASAQWVQIGSGGVNYVRALAVFGTNLYVGTEYDGVFLTTNSGETWTQTGLKNCEVLTLAVSGTNLFAGLITGEVWLSTDNGTSWTVVKSGLPISPIWALAVVPASGGVGPAILFAGTDVGVFLSTNNGTSWTWASSGMPDVRVCTLAVSDTNLFAGTYASGAYLSTDRGSSWTSVPKYRYFMSSAASSTNIFAGTDAGVYRFANDGSGWRAVESGLTALNVPALALSGTNLFAGTGEGVFVSNNGTNWTQVITGFPTNDIPAVLALTVSGDYLFAGTNSASVWRRPLAEMTPGAVPGILAAEWVSIPSGPFTYGSSNENRVVSHNYSLMKYEVTNAQYLQYLQEALDAGDAWVNIGTVCGCAHTHEISM